MGLTLNAAVGKQPGVANNAVDVRAVQAILIERADGDLGITVNGLADAPTLAAIVAYQKQVLKLPFPDGKITVGGTTHNFLNDPRKRFRGAPVRQGVTTVSKPGLPAVNDAFANGFNAEIARVVLPQQQAAFGQSYRDNVENWLKASGGIVGRIDDGRRFAQVLIITHKLGFTQTEVGLFIYGLFRFNASELDRVLAAFSPLSKFGGYVAKAGSVAGKLGFITLGIDVIIYGGNGDWGAAAGEVYKTYMNIALPWAAVVEGLASLADILLPTSVKTKTFFKVLRVLDPVGLGGAGFDAVYGLISFAMNANNPAEADRIINTVANRLEKGPAAFLKIPADAASDALYKWLNTPDPQRTIR